MVIPSLIGTTSSRFCDNGTCEEAYCVESDLGQDRLPYLHALRHVMHVMHWWDDLSAFRFTLPADAIEQDLEHYVKVRWPIFILKRSTASSAMLRQS